MNAVEFIKKFGWEYAKHILTDDAPLVMDLNYADLKRYVDAYWLVQDLYGLDKAKEYAESPYTAPEIVEPLKQAIALVEEI